MQETQVQSLGWEDALEKEMATDSSILAWRLPWTEEPGRLQSTGSQRVRQDWAPSVSLSLSAFLCQTVHSVQSLSCVQLFATPWTAASQASLSITNSQSSLRLMSIESVMPSSHLILCRPLLLLPPITRYAGMRFIFALLSYGQRNSVRLFITINLQKSKMQQQFSSQSLKTLGNQRVPVSWDLKVCISGSSFQFSRSVVSDLCDPMNHSTPGLPVHHQLLEFTQTHVHWVGDAIQPSHPLLSPSHPALNLSQHQGLFKWVSSSHQVAKVLEF